MCSFMIFYYRFHACGWIVSCHGNKSKFNNLLANDTDSGCLKSPVANRSFEGKYNNSAGCCNLKNLNETWADICCLFTVLLPATVDSLLTLDAIQWNLHGISHFVLC